MLNTVAYHTAGFIARLLFSKWPIALNFDPLLFLSHDQILLA